MKRIFIILGLVIIFLTGCSNEKYFICKINLDNDIQEYNLKAIYKVYYDDSYVTKIEKEEIYTSENKDTLKYFDEYKHLEYSNINDLYGGVIYNIEKIDNIVKLNATLDMTLINIEKMIIDKYIDDNYIAHNKLTISGIKKIYKEKGASCDI